MTKEYSTIIADDDTAVSGMLSMWMNSTNIEVLGIAKNGIELENLVNQNNPNFVITDNDMDYSNEGLETIQRLRSKNNIPYILTTGRALTIATDENNRDNWCEKRYKDLFYWESIKSNLPETYLVQKPYKLQQLIEFAQFLSDRQTQ